MIPITLFLIWLLFVLFCAGMLGNRLLRAGGGVPATQDTPVANFESACWLGLVLFVTLASVLSLIHPLDLPWTVGLSVLLILAAIASRSISVVPFGSRGPTSGKWLLVLVAVVWAAGMIFVASDKTTHYDTGLYHAQMVKWNKEFGVVPGLANLHSRLGYNSGWDVFAGAVDQGWFSGRAFHIVELLIGILFLFVCLRGYRQWMTGNRSISTILRCFGLVVLLFRYRDVLASLSNDWPITLLIYYGVILAVELIEQETSGPIPPENSIAKAGLLIAICFFVVTIKTSTGPILLLPVLFWIFLSHKKQIFCLIAGVGALVIVPFVARNIVLSGYIVFPFPALDLLSVDWKVPPVDAHFQATMIKYWAINPTDDWYRAIHMDFREQLHVWFDHHGSDIMALRPWLLIGATAWLLAALCFRKRNRPRGFWFLNAIFLILFIGIAFCLLAAPDPRFAEPWILAFSLFSLAWLAHLMVRDTTWRPKRWALVGQVALLGCTLWMVRHAGIKRFSQDPAGTLCRISDLPQASGLKEVRTEQGVLVRVPETTAYDQAWNADLPSTPDFNRWLRARGPSLKNGFNVSKPFVVEWRP